MTSIPRNGDQKKSPASYFIIGFVLLLCMGLSWAVDKSVVYIFLGAGCFFFFLGWYYTPGKISGDQEQPGFTARRRSTSSHTPSSSFIELVSRLFKGTINKAFVGPAQNFSPGIKVKRYAAIGVFMLMSFFIIKALFGSDAEDRAMNLSDVAEQFYNEQAYDSARIYFRRAFKLDPTSEDAFVGYGKVLVTQNQQDSAVIFFDEALKLNGDFREALYQKAMLYYDQKKYPEGIELLQSILDVDPEDYQAVLLMGDFYYTQGQYDDAISWYQIAYADGGIRSRILCHIMAYIYDTKGDYENAIPLYREALNYDSTVVDIYKRLGELIPEADGNFYREQALRRSR